MHAVITLLIPKPSWILTIHKDIRPRLIMTCIWYIKVLKALVCFSWHLHHVIYLNCYLKLSKFTKWQLCSLKMTTLFIYIGYFDVIFCQFAQLYMTVIFFSAWDKSHDPSANWSKLDHLVLFIHFLF